MADFTLDTSGVVWMPKPTPNTMMPGRIEWSHLSPFAQEYVEASWAEWGHLHPGKVWGSLIKPFGFSDLAPEALALILRDCATVQKMFPNFADVFPIKPGREFYIRQQRGNYRSHGFPPLTPYLDDGKVYLRK